MLEKLKHIMLGKPTNDKYWKTNFTITLLSCNGCSMGLQETHFNAEQFLIDCHAHFGEGCGSVVERRTLEREVGGSKPTSTMCP